MSFDLSAVEKSLGPVVSPLMLQFWNSTILPALQSEEAKVSNPELAVLSEAVLAGVDKIVKDEIAKLAAL